MLGWMIDAIIISALVAASWIPAVHAYVHSYRIMINNPDIDVPSVQAVTPPVVDVGMLSVLASACIAVAYYWLLTSFWGTTIGKRTLGTWVVTSAGRTKVGQKAAFSRAVVFVVGGALTPILSLFLYFNFLFSLFVPFSFLPVFFVADNLWLLGDRQRQCLHDKAADTIVVKGSALRRSGARRCGLRSRMPASPAQRDGRGLASLVGAWRQSSSTAGRYRSGQGGQRGGEHEARGFAG
jgi:uncharacterized RDD family membrane protein YckC